ncbi:MAG: SUMF1/EgtB/PvdO family nonheme iron enzyme [Novosphingobium sp.]|nr:SUMF1/EgtB/PvdO family nonheme iron enzyme [Novosphingobium sp.]
MAEDRFAALKSRTAELIARHDDEAKARREAQEAAWLAASRGLSDGQRQAIKADRDKADELLKAGDAAGAEVLYRKALAADHLDLAARSGLGQSLAKQGKLAEAAREFTEVVTLPLVDDSALMTRTMAMLAMQQMPPPADPRVAEPSLVFSVEDKPTEFQDAPYAPVMTVVPAGEFAMGSPEGEQFRLPNEQQHRVRIAYPLAFTKYNVTRGEFARFVSETGYEAKGCNLEGTGGMSYDPDGDWRTPGFDQEDDHPVACINFHDASAYAAWLSEKTGHSYRLPSEAEWEHAMRGGTSTTYYWGDIWEPGRANVDGQPGQPGGRSTTPGGTFPPNPFGLYDMAGNVWVWLADCYNASYNGAPTDGSAWMSGNCALRVRRSGSWFNIEKTIEGDYRQPGRLRSASRFASIPSLRYSSFGFRLVRDL